MQELRQFLTREQELIYDMVNGNTKQPIYLKDIYNEVREKILQTQLKLIEEKLKRCANMNK